MSQLRLENENDIVARAVQSDRQAFDLLYRHYRPSILRFLLRKVEHVELAEDLTQETFLRALENIHTYESRGYPFSSWLYQISRHLLIDNWRARKEWDDTDDSGSQSLESLPIPCESGERIDEGKKQEAVRRMLQELTPSYRDVLMMRFLEDRPIAEVASMLKKSEGAVKLSQHRAVKELKKMFGVR